MINRHLIDFSKIKVEYFKELTALENLSIPIDIASELLLQSYNKQDPLLIINISKILNEVSLDDYTKIYYNIIQQASNMDLMIDFYFENAAYEQILFFVSKFFTDTKSLKYVLSLVQIVSDAIIYSIDSNHIKESIVPLDVIKRLSEDCKIHIDKIKEFLNGIPLFMLTSLAGFIENNSDETDSSVLSNDQKLNAIKEILIKQNFEIVDDLDYLPRNIICLFYNSKFVIEYYKLVPLNSLNKKYFLQQYQGYIYNGMNLFYYFSNPENVLYHILDQISKGENKDFLKAIDTVYKNENL